MITRGSISVGLFEPTSRDMKIAYPELDGIEEFKGLSQKEMLMCWALGCPTSPYRERYNKDTTTRTKVVIKEYFRTENEINSNKELKNLFEGKSVASKYAIAIKRFATFNVSIRLRAHFMDLEMLKNVENSIYIDNNDMAGEISKDDDLFQESGDLEAYGRYLSNVKMARPMVPDLIARIESCYGLTIKEIGSTSENQEFKIEAHIDTVQ